MPTNYGIQIAQKFVDLANAIKTPDNATDAEKLQIKNYKNQLRAQALQACNDTVADLIKTGQLSVDNLQTQTKKAEQALNKINDVKETISLLTTLALLAQQIQTGDLDGINTSLQSIADLTK